MAAKTAKTSKHYIQLKGLILQKKPHKLFEVTDLNRVIMDQVYRGYDRKKADRIVVQMEVKDSLECLLAVLT